MGKCEIPNVHPDGRTSGVEGLLIMPRSMSPWTWIIDDRFQVLQRLHSFQTPEVTQQDEVGQ